MAERMTAQFAVFNCHVNDAAQRAEAEMKAQMGEEKYQEEIGVVIRDGIMAIFNAKPTIYTYAYVTLITAYVNENVEVVA